MFIRAVQRSILPVPMDLCPGGGGAQAHVVPYESIGGFGTGPSSRIGSQGHLDRSLIRMNEPGLET